MISDVRLRVGISTRVSLACHVYRCILLYILLVNPAGGLKATGLTHSFTMAAAEYSLPG